MPILTPDDVAIHRFALDAEAVQIDELAALLSPSECMRARRFHFRRDRDRFIVAHGRLRRVLSAYGAGPPERLEIRPGPYGKPALPPASPLRFNLSHAGGMAVVAVTLERDVGVDLEQVTARPGLRAVARRFFAPAEVVALDALADSDRVAAFYRCWTRKEAYVKAHGRGLSLALDSFEVSLATAEASMLLATRPDARTAADWDVRALVTGSSYVGAVAVRGRVTRVRYVEA